MMRGQSAVSDAHFGESLAIARDCGENGLAAWLGLYVAGHEPVARRIALMDQILERTPEGFQAFAYQLAADLIVGAGEFARAERYYTVSIGRWAEAGNIPMVGALKWMLASTLAPRGRLAQAAGLLDQGAQEGREGGDMVAWVRASSVRCELAWLAQEPAAADLFHAYLRDPAAFGPNWFGAIHRLMLVKVAYGLGDRDLGCRLEGDALTQLTPGTALAMHLVGEARGWGAFLMGDMPAAAAAFRRALAELRGSELRPAVASNSEHLAWVLGELGEIRGAAALLAQAASEREAMGMVLYPVEVPYHERALRLVLAGTTG
jgi:tetratricopeptide (TPR) repeat protein